MTSEQFKTMVLLGYRAVFDKKGGFGGGSQTQKYKLLFNTIIKSKSQL